MNIQFIQYMIEIHNKSIKAMEETNRLIRNGILSFADDNRRGSLDRNEKTTQRNRDRIHDLKRLNGQLTEMLEKANLTKLA